MLDTLKTLLGPAKDIVQCIVGSMNAYVAKEVSADVMDRARILAPEDG